MLHGVALYKPHLQKILPSPRCVLPRYVFAAIALICLVFAALPADKTKIGAGMGLLAALSGAGTAAWHVWIQAHPTVSCGIDPLETSLNTIPTATLMPFLFYADGLCTTEYPPLLGLSIPQWTLIWFAAFVLVLGSVAFKRNR